eukprot:scaffold58624_cov81-Cyclotella_meneghiniana.AAC.1
MQLDYNLGDKELRRVFDAMDTNGDGRMSLDEFRMGRSEHPFTRTLVETLSGASSLYSPSSVLNDCNFDISKSTAEFYQAPLKDGFHGEHVEIRKILDYNYHDNYTKERQLFQDALIRSNLLVGKGSEDPWYVLTCGPMGSGKGFILGWMSTKGILQLERVSKIDPDAFKLRMPEWKIYQANNKANVAGSMTHAESSYVAEIAQHLAMRNNMDVWIDGSLRNHDWYEQELKRIRRRHPQYRIAIIVISAPDEMIDSNIKKRAEETGRDIPQELRKASSTKEINHGVAKLMYLTDLVASVHNNPPTGDDVITEPVLKYVSMVDRSGNWDLIRELTSKRIIETQKSPLQPCPPEY